MSVVVGMRSKGLIGRVLILSAALLAATSSLKAEDVPDERIVSSHANEGSYLVEKGQYQEGIELLEQAAGGYRALGMRFQEAECLTVAAMAKDRLGVAEQALETYGKALEIFHEIGSREEQGKIFLFVGALLRSQNRPAEAIGHLGSALEIYRALGKEEIVCRLLFWLGEAGVLTGRYDDASSHYEEAFAMLREAEESKRGGQGHWAHMIAESPKWKHDLASAYSSTGRYQEAHSLYLESLGEDPEAIDPRDRASTYTALGILMRSQGKYSEAEQFYKQAEALYRLLPETSEKWANQQSLAVLYIHLGRYAAALPILESSVEALKRLGEDRLLAIALVNVGTLYNRLGKAAKGRSSLLEALAIRQKRKDVAGQANTLNNLAALELHQGRLEVALDHMEASLPLRRAAGDRSGEAIALINISQIYADLGRLRESWERAEAALEISREIGVPTTELAALTYMAQVLLVLEKFEESQARIEEAIAIARRLGDRVSELRSLKIAVSISLLLKDHSSGLDSLKNAEVLAREIDDQVELGEILFLRAAVHSLNFDIDTLLEQLMAYFEVQRETNLVRNLPYALIMLGAARQARGETHWAVADYLRASQALEENWSTIKADEVLRGIAGINGSLNGRLVTQLMGIGATSEAFLVAERARARGLLHQLENRELLLAGASNVPAVEEEVQLRRRLLSLERQLEVEHRKLGLDRDPAALRFLLDEQRRGREQYTDLRNRLEKSHPKYASLVGASPLELTEVQAHLDGVTSLLSYFVAEEKVFVWILGADSEEALTLDISAEELKTKVMLLYDSIATRDFDRPIARELYDLLFRPVEKFILGKRVLIAPHGILHRLPFSTLWDGAREQYLVEKYTTSQVPSGSLLPFLKGEGKRGLGKISMFCNPNGSLPGAENECRAIADRQGFEPLIGTLANETTLRRMAPSIDRLHIAAHAEFNPEQPFFSRIELAPDAESDGHLEVHEIYGLDLSASRLVVLSACKTALAERSEGDDLVGLTRAFLFAGASAVITSLWSIDDDASATLMTHFYQLLEQPELTNAEALRAAQLEMLRHPRWSQPFYWAAFGLTGTF